MVYKDFGYKYADMINNLIMASNYPASKNYLETLLCLMLYLNSFHISVASKAFIILYINVAEAHACSLKFYYKTIEATTCATKYQVVPFIQEKSCFFFCFFLTLRLFIL